jgi:hypothetical protein
MEKNKIPNFFKFLNKKEGTSIPISIRLFHSNEVFPDDETIIIGSVREHEDISECVLPKSLKVKGSFNVDRSGIKKLPHSLSITGFLSIESTPISHLPDSFDCGSLFIYDTPLAKKYTDEEIRSMGTIRKGIYRKHVEG